MLRVSAAHWEKWDLKNEILSTGQLIGEYSAELQKAGYSVYHLPFSKSVNYLMQLYSLLKKHNFDIVNIHTEQASFAYVLISKLAGIKTIVRTVHSTFRFKGFLRLERIVQRAISRWLGVRSGMISLSVKETERTYFYNDGVTTPNWFDNARFRPPLEVQRQEARHKLGLSPNTFAIVTIGNCANVKNHTLLLQALFEIKDQFDFHYFHVGEGNDTAREREMVEALGIGGRVNFLGTLPDPLPFLWAADVYVMPSIYEGFGVAAVEAMGTGCPAILSDVPGLRDFKSLGPGISFVPSTSAELASAILDSYRQPESIRRKIAACICARVHSSYTIQNGVDCIARDLYRIPQVLRQCEPTPQDQPC